MVQMMMMKLTLSKFSLRLQRLRPSRLHREDEEDEGSPCLCHSFISAQHTPPSRSTRRHHDTITLHKLPVFVCFRATAAPVFHVLSDVWKGRKPVLLSSSLLLVCVCAHAARLLCFAGKACRLHPLLHPLIS